MKAVFSNRAYAAILAETAEKIKTETGGLFLGAVKDNVWYVIETIDPGPRSVFEVAYFEYDKDYTRHLINKIANLYDAKLDLIGLWHRHPGSMDVFSMTDDETNSKYAALSTNGAISAIANIDPRFRLTVYHVGSPCLYTVIPYEVGDELIPDDFMRYKTADRFMRIMDSLMSTENTVCSAEYGSKPSLSTFMAFISGEISGMRSGNVREEIDCRSSDKIIDAVVSDLDYVLNELGLEITVRSEKGYVIVSQGINDKTECIRFFFADGGMFFSYGGKCYEYEENMLRNAFIRAKSKMERKHEKRSGRGLRIKFRRKGVY